MYKQLNIRNIIWLACKAILHFKLLICTVFKLYFFSVKRFDEHHTDSSADVIPEKYRQLGKMFKTILMDRYKGEYLFYL